MFEEELKIQRELNKKIIGHDLFNIDSDLNSLHLLNQKRMWFINMITAYRQEYLEYLVTLLEIEQFKFNESEFKISPAKAISKINNSKFNLKIELVDMLHFLLSMFLIIGDEVIVGKIVSLNNEKITVTKNSWCDMTSTNFQFSLLSHFMRIEILTKKVWYKWWCKVEQIDDESVRKTLYDIMSELLSMAEEIDMSYEEICELYRKKVKLNIERQEEGYKEGTYQKVVDGIEDNQKLND